MIDAKKQKAKLARLKAVDWVIVQYQQLQSNLKDASKKSNKIISLKAGTRA